MGIVQTAKGHPHRLRSDGPLHPFAPFQGTDAVPIQVVLPADIEELLFVLQPVQIEMEERDAAGVFVDDGEGGAADALPDIQATGQAADKGGLSAPRSPYRATTLPGPNSPASSRPQASVSSSEAVYTRFSTFVPASFKTNKLYHAPVLFSTVGVPFSPLPFLTIPSVFTSFSLPF